MTQLQEDNVAWCLHVRGPDDIVAMPSYQAALDLADWFTAVDRANIGDDMAPLFAAVPCLWPGSAEGHAADLARDNGYPKNYVALADNLVALTEIARKHPLCLQAQAKPVPAQDEVG